MTYIGKKPENIISTKIDTTTGTFSGEVDAGSLDISGNADIDGTLEADAITIDGTAIASVLSPIAGSSSIVTTGALNAGSITSGFGSINNGSSTITTTGAITGGSLVADNITIDGTQIDLSSGDFTLDVAGEIVFDADGGNFFFNDDSTSIGRLRNVSSDFVISSEVQDKDLIFKGNDGGSTITALTLDMSIGGVAKFNAAVQIPQYLTHLDDTDTFLEFGTDQIDLYAGNAKAVTIGSSQVIINQDAADMDFRVESNSNANAIFVQGSSGNVGMGTNNPAALYASDLVVVSGDEKGITMFASSTTSRNYLAFADGTSGNQAYRGFISYDHNNDELSLGDGATTRITMTSGNMKIEDGNLIIGTSGHGIDFSATGNSSGATNSELLDDYEEGNWTPVLEGSGTTSGVAYSRRQGRYTKVGDKVFVNFHIVLSDEGTIGSTAKISGLPFAGNGEPLYQVITMMSGNMALDKDQMLTGMQFGGNAFIYLMIQESDLALSQVTGNGSFKDNSEMVGSCTYYTNS
tara:strand:+ start:315 stop:1877 length:1563 start_codon:yes stop_codon:yes gene_type:complete